MFPENFKGWFPSGRRRGRLFLILAVAALAGCGSTPHADDYDYLREYLEPTREGLTATDKVVAEADCRAAARRHGASIMFGNFGGSETRAVFLKCMEERGWRMSDPPKKVGS